jgi:hypothetical protein
MIYSRIFLVLALACKPDQKIATPPMTDRTSSEDPTVPGTVENPNDSSVRDLDSLSEGEKKALAQEISDSDWVVTQISGAGQNLSLAAAPGAGNSGVGSDGADAVVIAGGTTLGVLAVGVLATIPFLVKGARKDARTQKLEGIYGNKDLKWNTVGKFEFNPPKGRKKTEVSKGDDSSYTINKKSDLDVAAAAIRKDLDLDSSSSTPFSVNAKGFKQKDMEKAFPDFKVTPKDKDGNFELEPRFKVDGYTIKLEPGSAAPKYTVKKLDGTVLGTIDFGTRRINLTSTDSKDVIDFLKVVPDGKKKLTLITNNLELTKTLRKDRKLKMFKIKTQNSSGSSSIGGDGDGVGSLALAILEAIGD